MTRSVNRRTVLGLIGGGLAASASFQFAKAKMHSTGWVTGARDSAGNYGLFHIDPEGRPRRLRQTTLRLHAPILQPNTDLLVAVSRRAGDQIYLVFGKTMRSVSAAPGRHFFGHAAFSADGATLFVGENDFETAKGLISVRESHQGFYDPARVR